jgi:hypothetical protein
MNRCTWWHYGLIGVAVILLVLGVWIGRVLRKKSGYETLEYPPAVNTARVGAYPALAGAGGGYVWDEVLEYRVWCHPEDGGDDYFHAFATYPEALAFSRRTRGAEEPIALIRQDEYISEPEPGIYVHVKTPRMTEWPVEFLTRPKRTPQTIPNFLSPTAPHNRLEILRGIAK